MPSNTTCDIYRNANAPPSAPDVAGVSIALTAVYGQGLEVGQSDATGLRYDHIAYMDLTTDIRDGYNIGLITAANQDHVWIPDQSGTRLDVVFVERTGYNSATDCKRVYLARYLPTWPTANL